MKILHRKKPTPKVCSGCWRLEAPLTSLSANPADKFTVGDSHEHVAIFGGTGSGKTSGSGAAIARAFLRAGFGGLVLAAKNTEFGVWNGYARLENRSSAIIRFDASGRYRFNFLDYLMSTTKLGGGLIDNAVHTLMHLLELAHGAGGGQGERPDFWMKAVRELLSNAIASLYHAYGRVTLDQLLQLVNTAPISEEQSRDADFQTWSFCYATMRRLFDNPKVPLPQREANLLVNYFGQTFGRLDPKTRSNIVITLSAEISPFMKGPLHTLFCTHTNIVPEVTHEGVILLLDLPIKVFEKTAVVAQGLMKYIWQKVTERRTVDEFTRPQFLFADEAQFFISSYDIEFLSTARSARASTVFITQNLPSLYAAMGGTHPQDRVDALLGNFQTKIFHSNTCHRTNQWAAEMIGKEIKRRRSSNWSHGSSSQTSTGQNGNWGAQEGESKGRTWGSSSGGSYSGSGPNAQFSYQFGFNSGGQKGSSQSRSTGGGWSSGTSDGFSDSEGGGWSEQMDYAVPPAFFASGLQQGGPRNDFLVTAILVQANRIFSRTGSCWTPIAFRQN